jgi:branched-chain amino acid transport system substrate-binding protein
MKWRSHKLFWPGVLLVGLAFSTARADDAGPIKIGMLLDLSSVYADVGGKAHLLAGRLLVEDAQNYTRRPVELLTADFQQNLDVAMTIARNWIEQGVGVIVDAPNSAIAIALEQLVRDKNRVYLAGAASTDLTGKYCTPNFARFMYNTYPYATVTTRELVKQGHKSFFLVNPDYALGHSFERDAVRSIEASGGKVLASIFHPLGMTDYAGPVIQAQSSGADVLATGSAGRDLDNLTKQAGEFKYTASHAILAMNLQIQQVPGIGLAALGGGYAADTFYWDRDAASRAFAERWFKSSQYAPSGPDAAIYSMMAHYLKAVEAVGSDQDGRAVVAKMKSMPVNDFYSHGGHLRRDGQLSTDVFLVQVKTPQESHATWDVYKIVATIPGEEAFDSPEAKECKLNAP